MSGVPDNDSMALVRGSVRYVIRPSVATDAFRLVDLSIEPVDGVPACSGRSVLRGLLVWLVGSFMVRARSFQAVWGSWGCWWGGRLVSVVPSA